MAGKIIADTIESAGSQISLNVGNVTVLTASSSSLALKTGSATAPGLTFSGYPTTGLYSPAANTIAFSTAGTENIRITDAGNVGIGMTPAFPLDITATTGNIRLTSSTGTNYAQLQVINGSSIARFGVESSVGGSIAGGTSAYSAVINQASAYPLSFGTNNTERMRIDSSGYVTNAVNGNGNGIHQAYQYYRLNSTVVGSNATGAQSIFGAGVTLVGSTVYEFEIVYSLSRTAGAVSHTVGIGFGGTATLNNISYFAQGYFNSSASALTTYQLFGASATGILTGLISTASSTTITTATTGVNEVISHVLKGTVSVNAGGTFIPQYTLSAAPGGAFTTQIGSYIKISALSASGAVTSIGSWA